MRKLSLFSFLSFFYIIILHSVLSLNCGIFSGSYPSGYSCLFSLYSTQNSHAGMCGYYQYSLCCDEIFSYINQTCNSSTLAILSFYQPNNTHVAEPNYYSWKLCAGYHTYPLECEIRDVCYENETCLVSLYSTANSHVAECNYYGNKLCCKKLSDLLVNSSSLQIPSPLVFGNSVIINVTIWNVGDTIAYNVNVSCYENGKLFDSKVIPSISPSSSAQIECSWTVSCLTNISIKVDPDNLIKELNESNNEAWQQVSIIEYLNVSIDYPANEQSFYRGQTIWLNSSVTSSCGSPPSYDVFWYNESVFIGKGEDIQWTIPLDDALLGRKNITAYANSTSNNYLPASKSINITILNNIPNVTQLRFNVTPAEIEPENAIQILCDAFDLEDCPSPNNCLLEVNISIRSPDGNWDNKTAGKNGNTFYREYTAPFSPLGNYIVYCSVLDSDNGYNEGSSTFLVYQKVGITLYLNSSYYWWNEGVKIYGSVKRSDGTPIIFSDLKAYVEQNLVCNTTTDINGNYACEFTAPSSIGNYSVVVEIVDTETGKIFVNSTILLVKVAYGKEEKEVERAKQVSCYEIPQLVINPDGSIKQVFVRVCILT